MTQAPGPVVRQDLLRLTSSPHRSGDGYHLTVPVLAQLRNQDRASLRPSSVVRIHQSRSLFIVVPLTSVFDASASMVRLLGGAGPG